MQMRTGRVSSRTFERDQVASGDDLPAPEARCERRQVPVQGRVTVAMNDNDVVSVPIRTRVEIDDTGVGGHNGRTPRCCDVDAGMDPVRVRTAGLVLLEPVAVAPEALADTAVPTRWKGPLELAGAAAGRTGCRFVLQRQRGYLRVDRHPLLLDQVVLVCKLRFQLLLVRECSLLRGQILLKVRLGGLLLLS